MSKKGKSKQGGKKVAKNGGGAREPMQSLVLGSKGSPSPDLCAAICTEQCKRPYQEDRARVWTRNGGCLDQSGDVVNEADVDAPDWLRALALVFDGHGGDKCSQFLVDSLHNHVLEELNALADQGSEWLRADALGDEERGALMSATKEAICRAFVRGETEFLDETRDIDGTFSDTSGSTCVLVLVMHDYTTICANVGDSRAVLVRENCSFKALSFDQTARSWQEKRRLKKANVPIVDGRCRGLQMTRVFGDFELKTTEGGSTADDVLAPMPDFVHVRLTSADSCIVVATDGIWDVSSNAEVAKRAQKSWRRLKSTEKVARDLCKMAVDHFNEDNVTCVFLAW